MCLISRKHSLLLLPAPRYNPNQDFPNESGDYFERTVKFPSVSEGRSQEVIAMMAVSPNDTEQLLDRAGRGDATARQQLLARHRDRLRRMVALRLDRRLAARVDPSDIVQESLAEAHQHLSEYLRDRPLPFYAWLRQFAWERVAKQYERHVRAQRRSVTRGRGCRPYPTSRLRNSPID